MINLEKWIQASSDSSENFYFYLNRTYIFSKRVLILLEFIYFFFFHIAQCGGHITGFTGEFTSPNYPKKYGDNLNCGWTIEAPQHHIIELRFQHFDIENGFDSVEIFDGDLLRAISLSKYSGSTKPKLIVSSGNKLRSHWLLDQLYGATGFLALYKANDIFIKTKETFRHFLLRRCHAQICELS